MRIHPRCISGYDAKKVEENVECEIMQVGRVRGMCLPGRCMVPDGAVCVVHVVCCCRRQVCAEEAKEAYDAAIVHEVPSNTTDDMDSNVARATAWVQSWRASHK